LAKINKYRSPLDFLAIGIIVFVPILIPLGLPVYVTSEVEAVFNRVDSLPPGSIVMLPMEYDPATMAELQPMAYAILRHCFSKNLKVITTALQIDGVTIIRNDLAKIAAEYNKRLAKITCFWVISLTRVSSYLIWEKISVNRSPAIITGRHSIAYP
jgi:hypothetical protein